MCRHGVLFSSLDAQSRRCSSRFSRATLVALVISLLCGPAALAASTPAPPAKPIPATYFGLHAQKSVTRRGPAAPFPTVPFGSFRLWSIPDWFQINGRPGQQYNWTALDRFLDLAEKRDVQVMFTVGHTPRWASSDPYDMDCAPSLRPGGCDPPKDLKRDGSGSDDYFRDFIKALARHAKGRIQDWEMWNEPGGRRQWTGTMKQLVRMTKDMHDIVKQVDPSALIVSPAYTGVGRDMASSLHDFFREGGGDYIDVVAFHGYIYRRPPVPEEIVDTVSAIREVMERDGQGGKPLWDTEGSWGRNPEYPDEDLQVAFVARMYLLQWGLGVERFYWWTWAGYPSGTLWDMDEDRLTKAGVAYKQLYDWMVGATQTEACREKKAVWICGYTRPGGYQAQAVWDANIDIRKTKSYTAPPPFTRYRDLEGNVNDIPKDRSISIGQKPVLLETGSPGQ
ncbi:MAG TPA: cellulase family glycosylhydrolase [Terriglobales bacterium]|jgi:hypothetical protein|nr:cellulase family glycosylhydrolase [Terriglobales bacterium]